MKPGIIAIVPARGGSKGIPRKNIRILAGKPLISYTIESALKSKYIDKVVVSTDDDEIAEVSRFYGSEIVKRPKDLAEDTVPLDPVIFHALKNIENRDKKEYEYIITIQPTSPLLKSETIDTAIERMLSSDYDSLISVKTEPHLFWTKRDYNFEPLYKERKNRQFLDPIYRETGSVLISKRNIISDSNRIGEKTFLFEIPSEEAIDIDTYQDWMIAENILKKKLIVFRVDGSLEIGMGHIYRAITLAYRIGFHHEVIFLMDNNKKIGIEKVKYFNYPVVTFNGEQEALEKLKQINPHIVINDILDTEIDYIIKLKNLGYFVVNFEDLGGGTEDADIVINSLYERSYPPEKHYFGQKYVCLRDEFYLFPSKKIKKHVKNLLITFGGTDPGNLTLKALKAIRSMVLKNINVTVVMGLGYNHKKELYEYIDILVKEGFKISVKENVNMMAHEIYCADIVITSNGRTIYEITSIGTPFISISQNERESRHLFVHYLKGVIYLGMAYNVSEEDIAIAIKKLIDNYDLRKKINENLLKADLKGGLDRTIRLIFDKYYEWEKHETICN